MHTDNIADLHLCKDQLCFIAKSEPWSQMQQNWRVRAGKKGKYVAGSEVFSAFHVLPENSSIIATDLQPNKNSTNLLFLITNEKMKFSFCFLSQFICRQNGN